MRVCVAEADVEGAYNITRESAERSSAAKRRAAAAEGFVATSEKQRREAQGLLEKHEQDFDKQFEANEVALENLNKQVEQLHTRFPSLNENVCGAKGDPCDEICGGPTCGRLVPWLTRIRL